MSSNGNWNPEAYHRGGMVDGKNDASSFDRSKNSGNATMEAANYSGNKRGITTVHGYEQLALSVAGNCMETRAKIKKLFKDVNDVGKAQTFLTGHLLDAQRDGLHDNGFLHRQLMVCLSRGTKSHTPPTWLANAFKHAFENNITVVVDFATQDADLFEIVTKGRSTSHVIVQGADSGAAQCSSAAHPRTIAPENLNDGRITDAVNNECCDSVRRFAAAYMFVSGNYVVTKMNEKLDAIGNAVARVSNAARRRRLAAIAKRQMVFTETHQVRTPSQVEIDHEVERGRAYPVQYVNQVGATKGTWDQIDIQTPDPMISDHALGANIETLITDLLPDLRQYFNLHLETPTDVVKSGDVPPNVGNVYTGNVPCLYYYGKHELQHANQEHLAADAVNGRPRSHINWTKVIVPRIKEINDLIGTIHAAVKEFGFNHLERHYIDEKSPVFDDTADYGEYLIARQPVLPDVVTQNIIARVNGDKVTFADKSQDRNGLDGPMTSGVVTFSSIQANGIENIDRCANGAFLAEITIAEHIENQLYATAGHAIVRAVLDDEAVVSSANSEGEFAPGPSWARLVDDNHLRTTFYRSHATNNAFASSVQAAAIRADGRGHRNKGIFHNLPYVLSEQTVISAIAQDVDMQVEGTPLRLIYFLA